MVSVSFSGFLLFSFVFVILKHANLSSRDVARVWFMVLVCSSKGGFLGHRGIISSFATALPELSLFSSVVTLLLVIILIIC